MTTATEQINLAIAMGEPLLHIKQLIPLLEYRQKLAKDMFNCESGSNNELALNEMIKNVNDNISKVLGLQTIPHR